MHRIPLEGLGCALFAALLLALGCTGSSAPVATPSIDPASFTDQITNPYFPLKTGTYVYDGTKDGAPTHGETRVTSDRKVILGVRTVVVHDTLFVNGRLEEDTRDWYAQDSQGDVWYFGEDTKELDPAGHVVSTEGTWIAGKNGAQPGILMSHRPAVGRTYQQEHAKGVAEDRSKVVRTDALISVPAGSYRDVVQTEDTTPLEPDLVERKWYAPQVGLVAAEVVRGGAERMQLTRFEPGA